ncbi:MAG TPA: hydrogenase maturation nickel metallochaperone HypA [Desulfuromonadaceae bacterium]|jgi:hydrogenase nickel incorporation protein HypA/HybF
MHEMSITQGIIEICEKHAQGKKVLSVDIEIGVLSNIVPEAIEFCFEACSRGTLMEGATLNVIRVPGSGRCHDCGAETPLQAVLDACAQCGSLLVKIEAGEEMRVKEIEVVD